MSRRVHGADLVMVMSAIWSDVVRLLWYKVEVYDLVHSRYFKIWPRFGTEYLRFGPIYSDLVIRVTR